MEMKICVLVIFYAVYLCDCFMEAVRDDKDWYLMCPDKCNDLVNLW